jgi:hypothetical protein
MTTMTNNYTTLKQLKNQVDVNTSVLIFGNFTLKDVLTLKINLFWLASDENNILLLKTHYRGYLASKKNPISIQFRTINNLDQKFDLIVCNNSNNSTLLNGLLNPNGIIIPLPDRYLV